MSPPKPMALQNLTLPPPGAMASAPPDERLTDQRQRFLNLMLTQ